MKPDNNDARQALNALLRDTNGGMSDADVNALISRELDKGEAMDADLVAEALRDQESSNPEARASHSTANWEEIERRLDQQERARAVSHKSRIRWIRAAAAVLMTFALVSLGAVASYAFRWNTLVKVFRPLVEDTLGIHMNAGDLGGAGNVERAESSMPSIDEPVSISVTIKDESKAPRTVRGLKATPSWLPDGYVFNYAEVFDDHNEASLLVAYRKGQTELFVQTIVYGSDTTAAAINVVEKEDQEDTEVPKTVITENEGLVNATREDDLACYMVWGRLSRDDISAVITSIQ